MFGGQIGVPMVLRNQGGTGRSAGAQHSQSLEAWIMHVPGLRLAMPATATDAYVLLRHALTLPDPVVFIEHKALYAAPTRSTHRRRITGARRSFAAPGHDLTIVTIAGWCITASRPAKRWHKSGSTPRSSICARSIRSTGKRSAESVRKTGRALIVSEGHLTAGVSAELSAAIIEEAFSFLEEPPIRLAAGEDVPIPVSPALEAAAVPSGRAHRHDGEKLGAEVRVPRLITMPRLGETMEQGRCGPGSSSRA